MQNQEAKKQYIYSVPCGPEVKGQTRIHRHPDFKDQIYHIPPEITSLQVIWDECLKKFGNKKISGDLSYVDIDERSKAVGSWLLANKHQKFFVYTKNCPNWTVLEIACWNYGCVNIPLYDTLGLEAFIYITKLVDASLVFMANENLPNFFKNYIDKESNIKQVCIWDAPSAQDRQKLQDLGLKVHVFIDILAYKDRIQRPTLTLGTELTYYFTSGTTAIPKGVIYTHLMITTLIKMFRYIFNEDPEGQHLSFLPIGHGYEKAINYFALTTGMHIGFGTHKIAEIIKDFQAVKPTFLTVVPRLLNRFYPVMKDIYQKTGSFDKVRAMFGGRVKRIVTGSAPISGEVLDFFSTALNCQITQGYGQTETTAGCFSTRPEETVRGHIGGPIPSVQFKLVDVEQMGYFANANPPRGQLCTRGDTIFKSYYKDPVNTKQTIDADGWNHSGDVGELLPNGAIKIIDRKKNIFKLQQGEYIAPQKIENVYSRCKFVGQSFVYGNSLQYYLVAIVHPNLEALPLICQKLGIQNTDPKTVCSNPEVAKFILEEMNTQGRNDGLFGFELAKKIKLVDTPFATWDIITNSMKVQRYKARNAFKTYIEELYADEQKV